MTRVTEKFTLRTSGGDYLITGKADDIISFLNEFKLSCNLVGKTIRFTYQKPGEPSAERLVYVESADHNTFGGKDLRDGASYKNFRYDRVLSDFVEV